MIYDNGAYTSLSLLAMSNDIAQNARELFFESNLNLQHSRSFNLPYENSDAYIKSFQATLSKRAADDYVASATHANGWIQASVDAMNAIFAQVQLAKTNAETGMGAEQDSESRLALSTGVSNIMDQLMSLGNTVHEDSFIFGGYVTNKQTFEKGENSVTNIITDNGLASSLMASATYSDLDEFDSGKYKLKVNFVGNIVHFRLQDSNGRYVHLDSNSSDEGGDGGNRVGTELVAEYKPGKLINLGRGLTFKLPKNKGSNMQYNFRYNKGQTLSYNGDDNDMYSALSENSRVAIARNGRDLFLNNYRTLTSSSSFFENGAFAEMTSQILHLDDTSQIDSNVFKVHGRDHDGFAAGAAKVFSPG